MSNSLVSLLFRRALTYLRQPDKQRQFGDVIGTGRESGPDLNPDIRELGIVRILDVRKVGL